MYSPLDRIIDIVFQFLYLSIFARIVLSWIPHDPFHPIVSFINRVSDPILRPFRGLIPSIAGLDLSPILAFISLGFIRKFIELLIR
jgi:YggT family protein